MISFPYRLTPSIAKKRSEILNKIRLYFDSESFLEVSTPLLASSLLPESSIEIFKSFLHSPYKASKEVYLIPSPEIYMKQLLAAGWGNIFQITPSFRNSEQQGKWHNNEFTMLEWYEVEKDYFDSQKRCMNFLRAIDTENKLPKEVQILTMKDAFQRWLDCDLNSFLEDTENFALHLEAKGCSVANDDDWESLFHKALLDKIEPELADMGLVFLCDYPSNIATTAKKKKNGQYYERWELYCYGAEIANCYTESSTLEEIQEYFTQEETACKNDKIEQHFVDHNLIHLYQNMPACSGVALGVDRLIMLLLDLNSINKQALILDKEKHYD